MKKGGILIVLGILGITLILGWDIILSKPVYDISGPKSIIALIFFAVLIVLGVITKKNRKEHK